MLREKLAAYLRWKMDQEGLYPEDVALRGRVRLATLYAILYGRRANPKAETVEAIARGLSMEPWDLWREASRFSGGVTSQRNTLDANKIYQAV